MQNRAINVSCCNNKAPPSFPEGWPSFKCDSPGNDEEIHEAQLMRARCKTLIALGDCAATGGICTMRNFFDKEEVLRRGYIETESTVDGEIPQHEDLTPLTDKVSGVDKVVPVDIYC